MNDLCLCLGDLVRALGEGDKVPRAGVGGHWRPQASHLGSAPFCNWARRALMAVQQQDEKM